MDGRRRVRHVERTRRLRAGEPLSAVTDDLCRRLGVGPRVLPMSDDPVRTRVLSELYGHHVDVLRVHGRVLVVAGEAGELADTGDPTHTHTQVEIIS